MDLHGGVIRSLAKGANIALSELNLGLGSLTVVLESRSSGAGVDADVSVLLLGENGLVRSSDDLVFYNQPVSLGGSVHLRDKMRTQLDPGDDEEILLADVVTLELDDVPDDVARIVVSASLDPETGQTFGAARSIAMIVQRSSDATDLLRFDVEDATTETALLFGEFYRRNGEWRVRAIGQGYAGGLAQLVTDHGVEIDGAGAAQDDAEQGPGAGSGAGAPVRPLAADLADAGTAPASQRPASVEDADQVLDARPVSMRRPSRAPKLPEDWDATIPATDGTDWQRARLFPVAGIGGGEEQERRATSALLAVMAGVREFGRALTARCGAHAGSVATFVEVPFGQEEEAYRPDGVVRVTRGQKEWTALVEVKTAEGKLRAEQIDHYVDIARARGFDAVITISNELAGGDHDHPVDIDRRKLRKVALVHLSWDQIRADAILLSRRREGVADATQRWILEEFLRYMGHPRAGMNGLADMGPSWVRLREAVKAKTARPADKATADVSARFDQLVQHVGLQLTGALGVDVRARPPRSAPDNATRCQQLADSGMLFGCLQIPGAVDMVVVSADIRSDRVTASITISAPRGETRPLTRINWLLRQLPATASDAIRVEALLAGGRGASTAGLLGAIRSDPSMLIPADQREIRAFTISRDLPMGTKRAAGAGTLINSVRSVTAAFYGDVVQHLRQWTPKAG